MVNGVDVNDNLFAQPQNLFIEDAIEETHGADLRHLRRVRPLQRRRRQRDHQERRQHVLGQLPRQPAEPGVDGRDAVRSLGHQPGDRRDQVGHRVSDKLQAIHEATFGGPIVSDRLWFFSAGRYQKTDTPVNLAETGISADLERPQQARRDQADRHGCAEPHAPGRLSEQLPRAHQQLGSAELHHRSRAARSTAPTRTCTTSRTTAACAATCCSRRSTRSASSSSPTTAAPAPTSSTRRSSR